MTTERIPYYVVLKGNGYWRTTPRMKQLGFADIRCGKDSEAARDIAKRCNKGWQAIRSGKPAVIKADALNADGPIGYVYFLRVRDRIKIGFSRNPVSRFSGLVTGLGDATTSFVSVRGTREHERRLHRQFKAFKTSGEWFAVNAALTRFMARAVTFGKLTFEEGEISAREQNGITHHEKVTPEQLGGNISQC